MYIVSDEISTYIGCRIEQVEDAVDDSIDTQEGDVGGDVRLIKLSLHDVLDFRCNLHNSFEEMIKSSLCIKINTLTICCMWSSMKHVTSYASVSNDRKVLMHG